MPNLSSSISIPVSTGQAGYQFNAQVNVANSSGSDIVIQRIVPRIRETGNPFNMDATSRARMGVSISQNPIVLAGSSNNYLMRVVFHGGSGAGTYDIGCDVYGTDGELISPTAVTVTVTLPKGT